jgi:hypothetical protein
VIIAQCPATLPKTSLVQSFLIARRFDSSNGCEACPALPGLFEANELVRVETLNFASHPLREWERVCG